MYDSDAEKIELIIYLAEHTRNCEIDDDSFKFFKFISDLVVNEREINYTRQFLQ